MKNKISQSPRNKRLEADLYTQVNRVTFITIRAFGEFSPFANPMICRMVVDTLVEEQDRLSCTVHAYCLMPDHLHYLIEPKQDGASVLSFTNQFKGKTTNRSWQCGWQGKLWEPRFYDHLVRTDESFRH